MKREQRFFLVSEDILPEAILKTAQVKEILAAGKVENVREAVAKVGLSRSAFYKYRDGIFPLTSENTMRIVNLSMTLAHQPGVLSAMLNSVSNSGASVLTINQNLPLKGRANVTLSIDTEEMHISLDEFINRLLQVNGVVRADIQGKS
ncbi:MAG: ACT domain-containing protein [Methylocystaceae bacterium]